MKITSQEEYGLRILIRIARSEGDEGMSIPQLSETEGLSEAYVAKLCRLLRIKGFINSTPGYKGGYILSKPANEILINSVLKALGGSLYNGKEFCGMHAGVLKLCTNSVDCSARSLWKMIQFTVDQLLDQVTLQHLAGKEDEAEKGLQDILLQKKG